MDSSLLIIKSWIDKRQPNYVCCVPAHTVMECFDHPELRKVFIASGLNTPDGMAIVWLLRQAGYHQVERVYGPDLLLAACQTGVLHGWRHYFLGGRAEVVDELVFQIKKLYPGLEVAGVESPPFRELSQEEESLMVERIHASCPDILWVGLGSPKQERWMYEHVNKLEVPVLIGVGAAFDFIARSKSQAPRWIQRSGLEWFYRLMTEPSRLWQRYLFGYPRFVILILLQQLGLLKLPNIN